MGAFDRLIGMMFKDNGFEKEEEALKNKGEKDADKIAEKLGQKEDKTAFVPKIDVPPVELPEKSEKAEKGKDVERE